MTRRSKQRERRVTSRRWFQVRLVVLSTVVLVAGVAVMWRAYVIQVAQAPSLREMAEGQHLREIRVAPRRGAIYDRHGAELAVSVDADSVFANPRQLRANGGDPALVGRKLARALGLNRRTITKRLRSDKYFVWIKRRVTPHEASEIRAMSVKGLGLTTESRRYYPNRHLASHLLGFSNIDAHGIEGLELSQEHRLRGSDRRVPTIRDRRGQVVFADDLLDERKGQGHGVTLTIDKTIQHVAERELSLGVRTFEARGGSVVVMDPRSGEVLALANYPQFNPNEPGKHPVANRRNRAVVDRFEPGSTIKPFTMAAAISNKAIQPDQAIHCEKGRMRIGDAVIHDSHPHELLTPTRILAVSSNICTAKIAARLGKKRLYQALRRFGFAEPTGLEVPGEPAGILRHYRRWYEIDTAAASFGQGMSVTNVQLVTAMSALANGGQLMKPQLIRRVTDPQGAVVFEAKAEKRRQVVPRRVARLVAEMLTAVTEHGGTGVEAAIEGYVVGGKTGTAQKADYVKGGYAEDRWVASFIGFVPAQDPQLVISVVIDEPMIAHYGGTVAGPVFRRVGEASLRHLGIAPSGAGSDLRTLAKASAAKNGSPRASEKPKTKPVRGKSQVPDLAGTTLRSAVVSLHGRSLVPGIQGSGIVVEQQPRAGTLVPHGTEVRIVLRPHETMTGLRRDEVPSDERLALQEGGQ